jgi:hypothetical protein
MAFTYGFLQKNDAFVCWMRMCMKAQSACWHQPGTEEEPIEALDPPESLPWMLTRGIPCFTPCIAAGPARLRRVRWHPTIDLCSTTECAKASLLLAKSRAGKLGRSTIGSQMSISNLSGSMNPWQVPGEQETRIGVPEFEIGEEPHNALGG